jgi:hypothetical protein
MISLTRPSQRQVQARLAVRPCSFSIATTPLQVWQPCGRRRWGHERQSSRRSFCKPGEAVLVSLSCFLTMRAADVRRMASDASTGVLCRATRPCSSQQKLPGMRWQIRSTRYAAGSAGRAFWFALRFAMKSRTSSSHDPPLHKSPVSGSGTFQPPIGVKPGFLRCSMARYSTRSPAKRQAHFPRGRFGAQLIRVHAGRHTARRPARRRRHRGSPA